MPKLVNHGATLKCSEGLMPSQLTVLPVRQVDAQAVPAATVADWIPMVNVAPFGLCRCQANPQVAAATAAAMGILTPMPCVPVIIADWSPGAAGTTITGQGALTSDSTCSCLWSGRIEITRPACDVDVE